MTAKSRSAAFVTAQILTEALPYIRRYQGKTIVIKYGGNAFGDADLRQSFARDVILMQLVGMRPVVVHGGGPQIGETLQRLGKESTFVDGLRVTDAATMEVVEMVLCGSVNKSIVQLINSLGGRAVGLSGKDGGLIRARKLRARDAAVDYGQVGAVESIHPRVVQSLQAEAFIPVIAPIGAGADGQTYNINADSVAGQLAIQLRAEKLILLTNTRGVLDADGELLAELDAAGVAQRIQTGDISGGMIPKAECAVAAVQGGVASALVVDGRVAHALLLEIFTDAGVGTQIRAAKEK